MRTVFFIVAFLACSSFTFADKRAIELVDDVNTKTGEPYFFFYAGEFERGFFTNIHSGFSTRRDKWLCRITVRGAGSEFPAERIEVTEGVLFTPIPLAGGSLTIDRKKRTVTLTLKVKIGDKIEGYHGNGIYYLEYSKNEKKPIQSSQPTPGS